MRISPDLGYGTARFPDKVARQLRALNFACGGVALMWLAFAAAHFLVGAPLSLVGFDAGAAIAIVLIPQLHRFGSLAAAYAFVAVSYAASFHVCLTLGTDSGIQVQFLAIAAGMTLLFGAARWRISAIIALAGAALIIVLQLAAPDDAHVISETAMFAGFVACVVGTSAVLFLVVFYAVREASRAEARAEFEYERSESLLVNILPASIASRLKGPTRPEIADRYEDASILFADMVGFTERTSAMTPAVVVGFLNQIFAAFDRLVEKHELEKIKTTGDNYMVVSGVPEARPNHAIDLAHFALEMVRVAGTIIDPNGRALEMRIGLASGPVVAGVVGTRKFFYDVWGDAVNVASRMESTGVAGRIQVSSAIHAQLEAAFLFEPRGSIDVKGKGRMETWFLTGLKP